VRRCPRCVRRLLEPCTFQGHHLDLCPGCRGLWCEPSEWDRAQLGPFPGFAHLAQPDQAGLQPAEGPRPSSDVHLVGPSPLGCPNCKSPLTRLQVGGPDDDGPEPFEIDQCERCGGVWFDHGQWERLEAVRAWQSEEQQLDTPTTWGQWIFQFFLGVPIAFNVAPRRFPVVTVSLIVVCTLVYLAQAIAGPDAWQALALEPDRVWTPLGLLTLLTGIFMHANVLHLLGNMYFLYILGVNVEDVLGRWLYPLFYLVCGLVANIVYVLCFVHSGVPLVGASGAIAGVMAAYALLFPRARLTFMLLFWQFKVSPWLWMGIFLAIQLVGAVLDLDGKASGVAHVAHLGGFLAGLVIILPVRPALIRSNPLLSVLHTWHRPGAAKQAA
jgi:membrane associated rhomboid family serine protease